jgi:hypothetical protein
MHHIPIGYMVKGPGHEMQPVPQMNAAVQIREARRDRLPAGTGILGMNEPRGQSKTDARLHQQVTETEEAQL